MSEFIVAVKNSHGGWSKAGIVKNNKRCVTDNDFSNIFPINTKSRIEVLKACKWLSNERAVSVDLTVRNNLEVRVHKI